MNLGKWGAIAGVGKSTADLGGAIMQNYLNRVQATMENEQAAARETRSNAEWERRNAITSKADVEADQRRADREAADDERATNRALSAEERAAKRELDRESREEARDIKKETREIERKSTGTDGIIKIGDTAIRTDPDGQQWAFTDGDDAWRKVGIEGVATESEIGAEADSFADKVVSERAGWFSSDKEDFPEYQGSQETAREDIRRQFLQGRGAPVSTPAAPATLSSPATVQPSASSAAPGSDAEIITQTRAVVQQALSRGVSRNSIISRLRQQGATEPQIQQILGQ